MPVFAPLPNSPTGMQAFDTGFAKSQEMFDSLMKNKLVQAQAKRENVLANLPFGGETLPGVAGQIAGLEMIRQQYGENSPQYQQAQKAFNLSQQSDISSMNYRNALTNSMPQRYLTPEGRSLIEESNVSQGASPAGTPTGTPIAPGLPPYVNPMSSNEATANQYALGRTKKNAPTKAINSSLLATNAEQTLDNINVDDLTQYSGLKGSANLLKDKAQSASGIKNDKFIKYQKALTNAALLAKQYRQMMGDSITPSNQEALNFITNPTSWMLHPDVAKAKFNTFRDTLKRESKVFQHATQSNAPYTGNEPKNESEVEGKEPPPDTIWMIKNGKKLAVHEGKIEEAKARGYSEVK